MTTKKRKKLKGEEYRVPVLEVCYKKLDGHSERAYGFDLDFAVKEHKTDYTNMLLTMGTKIVVGFPTTSLVWARVQHKAVG